MKNKNLETTVLKNEVVVKPPKPFFSKLLERQVRARRITMEANDGGSPSLDCWTSKWPSDSDDNWEATFPGSN